MTIITDIREERKLFRARCQPDLNFLSFSPVELFKRIRSELFPELTHQIDLYFVEAGPLACIWHTDKTADIYIHQILNHSDTPREVISLVIKHELLHLRIPRQVKNGITIQHPPEFQEAEQQICPESTRAWIWIKLCLEDCIKERKKLERIDVRKNWKKMWSYPRLDLAGSDELGGLKPTKTDDKFC